MVFVEAKGNVTAHLSRIPIFLGDTTLQLQFTSLFAFLPSKPAHLSRLCDRIGSSVTIRALWWLPRQSRECQREEIGPVLTAKIIVLPVFTGLFVPCHDPREIMRRNVVDRIQQGRR